MHKNISRIECTVGERIYNFDCSVDSPIADAKEALFQIQKYLGQLEDNIKVLQEEQKKKDEEIAAAKEKQSQHEEIQE
jgi:alanyl-tRNA synthetase